jgi:hypothetical protein
VHEVLEFYSRVYQELLAVPVVKGIKTEKEKVRTADFSSALLTALWRLSGGSLAALRRLSNGSL